MFAPFYMLLLLLQLLLLFGGVYLVLLLAWHALELYTIAKDGDVHDLDLLQQPQRADGKLDGTAVVCGGSIGGLLAARVCQKHFCHVVIVEPEAWLATDAGRRVDGWRQDHTRSRVMQYKSLQGNQGVILKYLTKMFPGFQEECQRSGIHVGPADFATAFAGTLVKMPWKYYTRETMPRTIFSSRKGLETIIRRLVFADGSGIRQMAGVVIGVKPDEKDPSRIGQVSVRTDSGNIIDIDASLVVDCTGVTRAGMKWLSRAGYGQPSGRTAKPLDELKISFDQKLQYSSIILHVPPELFARLPLPEHRRRGAICTYLEDQPSLGRRFFVLANMDGDQMVVFCGQSSDDAPRLRCLDDMLELAHSLVPFRDPVPQWVFDTIEMLKEVETSECVSQVRVPPMGYIQYHLADNLPSNFAALGDSVMSVNPTLGQGCPKACKGAIVLNSILHSVKSSSGGLSKDFSTKFFKRHYQKTNPLWQSAKLLDYGIPCTVPLPGEKLSSGAWMRAYIRRMQILAITDDHAALTLFRASHDLGTPMDPFHPALFIKIMWDVLRRPRI